MALQSSTLRVELPGLRALSRNPRRGRMVVKDRSLRAVWVPYNQQNGDKGLPEQQPPTPTPSRQPAQPEVTDEQQAAGNAESPKSVTRLSVVEQLKILREAQAKSQRELARANVSSTIGADPNVPREFRGHRTVDVRMYDQMSASRNRMSQNLSRANKYINILETEVEKRDERLAEMKKEMVKLQSEITTLIRMSELAKAQFQFSVDKEGAVWSVDKLTNRLKMAQEASAASLAALDAWCVREVPIEYHGRGAEVRIMGSFDSWTMGQQLSSDSMSDAVFQTFQTTLRLIPGEYRIKFLVDGEWRTAGDWPTATDSMGNLENILVVE